MTRNFVIFIFAVFYGTSTFSQHSLTIKVIDDLTKEPLAFANVFSARNVKGTSTDLDGKAILQYTETDLLPDSLEISFIGYKTKVVIIDSKDIIDVKVNLKIDVEELNEIVVYGNVNTKYTAAQLVRKVIKKIPKNYEDSNIE